MPVTQADVPVRTQEMAEKEIIPYQERIVTLIYGILEEEGLLPLDPG